MRFFRLVAVLLLLTVWLTAKEHCTLETLGVLPDSCATKCADACESDDACGLVESSSYKQAVDHVHVAPPTLLLCLFAAPISEKREGEAEFQEPAPMAASLGRMRTWQFVERAAPPARAPALNV